MATKTTAFMLPTTSPPEGASPTEGWILAYFIRFVYHHELNLILFENFFPQYIKQKFIDPTDLPLERH